MTRYSEEIELSTLQPYIVGTEDNLTTRVHVVVMDEIRYEKSGDKAVFSTNNTGEWIESDSIALLEDWV